ncbi:MAG: hypothetical protein V2A79_15365 [Planctomycetota bacterium]
MHQHDDHPHGKGLATNRTPLAEELGHHLPFSVSAVAIGLIVAGIICFLTPVEPGTLSAGGGPAGVEASEHLHEAAGGPHRHAYANPFQNLFHLFHPVHMLFSAAATTAMFWRYERRVLKTVIIGLIGAIGICGLSDIVIPQLALTILGKSTPWHVCVIEHPSMVLSFASVGVILGLAASPGVRRSTFFSHSLHVFVSTMASIFYLIGPFGVLGWIDSIGTIFLFIIVAVMVPCCVSDIVFPLLLLTKRSRAEYQRVEHACHGEFSAAPCPAAPLSHPQH